MEEIQIPGPLGRKKVRQQILDQLHPELKISRLVCLIHVEETRFSSKNLGFHIFHRQHYATSVSAAPRLKQ